MGCGVSQEDKNVKIPGKAPKEEGAKTKSNKVEGSRKPPVRCKRGEVITIGVGGAGTNSLQFFFDGIAKEHQLYDGKIENKETDLIENFNSYFSENRNGKLMARGVIIDSGKEVNMSQFMNSFNQENFVTNLHETETNFYEAYACNCVLIDIAIEAIRKESEKCDYLSGFQLFHSCGGAGSGYGSKILEMLSVEYGGKNKMSHLIVPSFSDPNPLLTFNTMFCISKLIEHNDLTNLLCNDNMLKIVKTIPETNEIIGKMVVDLSSLNRFSSTSSFSELLSSIIPWPITHFITTSLVYPIDANWTENQIIDKLYDDENSLGHINSSNGKYFSTFQIFRGNKYNNFEILNALSAKSSSLKYCDYSEEGGISHAFSGSKVNSCLRVSNHSSIKDLFKIIFDKNSELKNNNDPILNKFVERGMEMGEIYEGIESLRGLIEDHEDMGDSSVQNE